MEYIRKDPQLHPLSTNWLRKNLQMAFLQGLTNIFEAAQLVTTLGDVCFYCLLLQVSEFR